ncbi:MAG: hypothetical protein IT463_11475, partial [Planctomycetes bacterium]|nr:hypothetical protein [Planctomycetota bacterium]
LFNALPGPRGCTGRSASGFTPRAGQLLSVEEGANGDFFNGLLGDTGGVAALEPEAANDGKQAF